MNPIILRGSLVVWLTILVGCTTLPETGRRQMIFTSPAQEAQMGVAAFSQIKQEETISQNVMANDRVTRVGQRIAASVGRELPNAQWEFVVFESDELNAFALPGDKVGVYTGLLALTESDDELAAVMGHEVAHVTSRHSGERYSQQVAAAGIAVSSDMLMEANEVDPQKRAIAQAALGAATTVGVMLPFSRLHESEADAVGLRFAAGAGYDPRAAIRFWQRMQEANANRAKPWEFLSTHPSDETRIANLKRLAPQYEELYERTKARIDQGEPIIGTSPADRVIGQP